MGELNFSFTRVLVVDDDETFLKIMASYLSKLGCPHVVCRNGREALDAIKNSNFDICFMDIMMPEMNGIEAAQIIRDEMTKLLPIIAITSSGMKATRDKCIDVGMNDFITKPVSFEVIRDSLLHYALRAPSV